MALDTHAALGKPVGDFQIMSMLDPVVLIKVIPVAILAALYIAAEILHNIED